MKTDTYESNKSFKRRNLYIHNENARRIDILSAKKQIDKSQALNLALAMYFTQNEGEWK